ncbi:DNA-binding protein [Saccharomonospora iraqiensis]|uniref:DNA-binding protein n=1 Tax=Saccharomonospora iraqiensis TaxID=52698 RepID=UPI00047EE5D3|nr:DNA-binding protein [Saccharomonospora iraqiensis]
MNRRSVSPGGSLVLDSEGLAKAVRRDRALTAWFSVAHADDLRIVTSAAILVEVMHPRINRHALDWTLSRLIVELVSGEVARLASTLLADANLHGHRHAIDAMLVATAMTAAPPVTVLTSDPEDLSRLGGPRISVAKV